MKQKGIRHLLPLLIIYTSLEAFRHIGWMLFYEQMLECSRQSINLGFILYSMLIFITALVVPKLLKCFDVINNSRKLQLTFVFSVSAAIIFRLVQLFSDFYLAYIFMALSTVAIMICICICLIKIVDVVPGTMLGRFTGTAYFIDAVIVSLIELLTGTDKYYLVSILIGTLLCISAAVIFLRHFNKFTQECMQEEWRMPSNHFVKLALITLIIYVLIAGMTDNLYFFDNMFALPYVGLFFIPMTGILYLVNGFLFDKFNIKNSLPIALVFICAAQSIAFFMKDSIFAYTYSILFAVGSTYLELATLMIPIYFARTKKRGYQFAVLGDGLFYGGYCIASIVFLFIKQEAYFFIMGLVLISAVICLLLVMKTISLYEKQKQDIDIQRQKTELEDIKQKLSNAASIIQTALPQSDPALELRLTKRERSLLPLIASSLTAEEIAQQENVSLSTIRFHIKNILGKTGAKSRRELIKILGEEQLSLHIKE